MFRAPSAASGIVTGESTNSILDSNTMKKSGVSNGKYNDMMGKKSQSTFGVKS